MQVALLSAANFAEVPIIKYHKFRGEHKLSDLLKIYDNKNFNLIQRPLFYTFHYTVGNPLSQPFFPKVNKDHIYDRHLRVWWFLIWYIPDEKLSKHGFQDNIWISKFVEQVLSLQTNIWKFNFRKCWHHWLLISV